MGWIVTILTSGLARKALGLMLATLTVILFLLNLRRSGEQAGRLAERLSTSEKAHEMADWRGRHKAQGRNDDAPALGQGSGFGGDHSGKTL